MSKGQNTTADVRLSDMRMHPARHRRTDLQRDDVVLLGRPVERRLVVLVDVLDARAEVEQRVDGVGVAVTGGDQKRREVVLVVLVDASAPGQQTARACMCVRERVNNNAEFRAAQTSYQM